ncbi:MULTISPECIES: conjugal transfer protein TraF [unclassified Streptococcus]|uniref:conjugal transfer protein TraF n=1 Tax=unclassified Streptococcus TaxID=2608887 RepID=UPI0011B824AE|nr:MULTISPECIES: conjugal transfer protein TraF [unclassified Streptococcus]TWS94365.1 thiol reductase thioredoxin [Streptococcus sp. sy018]TWT10332.1 thiol reductase thioredoxin [Streptococcus sp. sy004]TWT14642.1 thiol reductase thioredoxin [Streptococcus sp. sy010]
MKTFAEIVSNFNPTTVETLQSKFVQGEKVVLFLGRATCPYCQRFAPKLANVVEADGLTIDFINSEEATQLESIQNFRHQYEIKTVPALLVAENGQVKVVCDSSLSEDEIRTFIG